MVNLFGRQTKVEVGLEVIQKYSEYASVVSGVFVGSRCRILENNKKEKTVKASVDVFGTPVAVVFRYEELKFLSKSEV